MRKRYFITLLLSLLYFSGMQAQTGSSDATYRTLIREYTLNPDGSSDFRQYKEVVLHTYYAFHRQQGETFIIYNPAYQELKINDAYTIMADGKKIVTPENAFNEVLPRFAANAPAFNHLREMVVTHTGLEIGAVIHLDYSIHSREGFMPAFMGEEMLKREAPVKEMKLIVRIPGDQDLRQKTVNIRTAPEIAEDSGMKVYTWVFRDLPAETWDENQVYEDDPGVIFSTGDLQRAFFEMVKQAAFTFQTGPELSEMAAGIAKSEGDDLKTIMKLQSMVSNDLHTWNVPNRYLGYRCRTPREVWKSNGGTPLEKSVLLASLLIHAGINAKPLLVFPSKFYDPSVACLPMAESVLVQVNPREMEQWIISPSGNSDRNQRYDLPGKTLLLLDGSVESLKTFEYPVEKASIKLGVGFVFQDTNRMTGTMTLELTRQFNPFFKLKEGKDNAANLLNGISKSNIKNIEVKKLSEVRSLITYDVEIENPFRQYGGYLFWTMPESREGLNIRFLQGFREAAYLMPDLLEETFEYSVVFPENMELITPLKSSELDYSFGKLVITMKQKGNEVFIKKEIQIRERVIRAVDYPVFRGMINQWINPEARQLVFRSRTY